MKTLKVDVIVVGAGPAGVAAVRALTAAGAKVALIEKVSFPRAKPCAGGLSVGALRLLDYSVTEVVREEVNECQLSCNLKTPVLIKSEKPFAAMTKRIELDALGLDAALATGCHFLVLPDIQGLKQDDHGIELLYSDIRVQSDYLVAADGASSSIRRLIYGRENKSNAIAIEANVDSACKY
jgi:flavin-dependent dehydrogenase